ncbi:uncharacterized protein Pyn_09937 [Prunus yedoensis var. nudiflora]|uniref:Uncharacterized protein n=1 Tax=Prunus yedoensis var. nudiflora TaxID=2094558 RepID=A0A314XTR8_PRUYE|nr:uncharacterized protein Pyn_09937 [Prunus yedoensis var. nudiflora]
MNRSASPTRTPRLSSSLAPSPPTFLEENRTTPLRPRWAPPTTAPPAPPLKGRVGRLRLSSRSYRAFSGPDPINFGRILLYADESNNTGGQRPRGLSPDITPDPFEDCERSRSGSGDSSGATPEWKQTPALAPSSTRRTRVGQVKNNVSGLAFCLSPLVRASPNRNWGQKGLPPEFAGEIRVAAAFCKNRSRKLVDFGRANPNR